MPENLTEGKPFFHRVIKNKLKMSIPLEEVKHVQIQCKLNITLPDHVSEMRFGQGKVPGGI